MENSLPATLENPGIAFQSLLILKALARVKVLPIGISRLKSIRFGVVIDPVDRSVYFSVLDHFPTQPLTPFSSLAGESGYAAQLCLWPLQKAMPYPLL